MYNLAIIFLVAFALLVLSIIVCLHTLTKIINNHVARIKEGKYMKGIVEDKVSFPVSFFIFKKYYIIVNQHMYHLSVNEYKIVEVGKEYTFVLSNNKHEVLKVVKDLKLYQQKVSIKDVIKNTKIYQIIKR